MRESAKTMCLNIHKDRWNVEKQVRRILKKLWVHVAQHRDFDLGRFYPQVVLLHRLERLSSLLNLSGGVSRMIALVWKQLADAEQRDWDAWNGGAAAGKPRWEVIPADETGKTRGIRKSSIFRLTTSRSVV